MFMISLTILFLSGMSRFMDEHVKKLRLLLKFAMRVLSQLLSDLWAYYASPYPFLLIMGVFRRIFRRAKALWLPKGRGRPSVGEDVVELILDMKRSNWSWGALDFTCVFDIQGVQVFILCVADQLRIFKQDNLLQSMRH